MEGGEGDWWHVMVTSGHSCDSVWVQLSGDNEDGLVGDGDLWGRWGRWWWEGGQVWVCSPWCSWTAQATDQWQLDLFAEHRVSQDMPHDIKMFFFYLSLQFLWQGLWWTQPWSGWQACKLNDWGSVELPAKMPSLDMGVEGMEWDGSRHIPFEWPALGGHDGDMPQSAHTALA